jgi:hypothetical protein
MTALRQKQPFDDASLFFMGRTLFCRPAVGRDPHQFATDEAIKASIVSPPGIGGA